MSALHLLRDGAALAAEFAALLFLTPIGAVAAEPAQPTASVARDAERATPSSRLQALHVTNAALELRLLGLLADVRVMQTVRNDTAIRVDLGARLPAVTDSVDELAVIRDGRVTDLLDGSGNACGEDDDPDAGRAQGDADEARADALQLMPGQHAIVAIAATETLEPAGDAFRVALPATIAALGPQARVFDEAGGATLVVIPPEGASGIVTVTLRPASAPSRTVRLGRTAPGIALVVPLQDAERSAIATTIVELEIAAPNEVRWMTLVTTPQAPIAVAGRTRVRPA